MASDWIKFEHVTPDKSEVIRISVILKIDQDAVTGKLLRIWIWADQNSIGGNDVAVTESFLDRLTHRKGFASAMRDVGWLTGEDGLLSFPRFERHNGTTAKARADTNRRVAALRIRNANVTENPLQNPLPEKRRVEKNGKEIDPAGLSQSALCSLDQAIAYAPTVKMTAEQAEHWWHVRNAAGWTKGSTGGGAPRKITSWQSDMASAVSWVGESQAKSKNAPNGQDVIQRTNHEWEK